MNQTMTRMKVILIRFLYSVFYFDKSLTGKPRGGLGLQSLVLNSCHKNVSLGRNSFSQNLLSKLMCSTLSPFVV